MAEHMELLGADYCEHLVFHPGCGVTRAVSVLAQVPKFSGKVDTSIRHVGNNRGHDMCIQVTVTYSVTRDTGQYVTGAQTGQESLRVRHQSSEKSNNPVCVAKCCCQIQLNYLLPGLLKVSAIDSVS